MEKIQRFTDLIAWQEAHKLVLEVYLLTNKFPKAEIYGLVSQLRRAVVSITANIGDRINFYYNARGSLSEVQNFIILAQDLSFIEEKDYQQLSEMAGNVERILNGLVRSTKERKKL